MNSYTQLHFSERQTIARLLEENRSLAAIARALGRNRSTITREVERNSITDQNGKRHYQPVEAQQKKDLRRCQVQSSGGQPPLASSQYNFEIKLSDQQGPNKASFRNIQFKGLLKVTDRQFFHSVFECRMKSFRFNHSYTLSEWHSWQEAFDWRKVYNVCRLRNYFREGNNAFSRSFPNHLINERLLQSDEKSTNKTKDVNKGEIDFMKRMLIFSFIRLWLREFHFYSTSSKQAGTFVDNFLLRRVYQENHERITILTALFGLMSNNFTSSKAD